jgi:outer membrane protein
MKSLLKISFLAVVILLASNVYAQKLKFGHTDSQKLVEEMPELKAAQETLKLEQKKIEDHLMAMQTEYQGKVQEYLENEQLDPKSPEKWTALAKADKESEIKGLEDRITKYQSNGEQSLQTKQQELYQPILDKVQKAIKDVATEGEFTYIFDKNAVLYYSETQSVDVTPLIKKKLGITE